MKNFHLPLPEQTYKQLREAAALAEVPATALAREAIDAYLRANAREARRAAMREFAIENAGTSLDLDTALESASIEHLTVSTPKAGKKRK